MEKVITDFIHAHMYLHIIVIAVCMGSMLMAMAVDLIFGVQKARELGVAATSTGYKKTADKARKYFSPFITLVFIDLIACALIPLPAFSMVWAAYCVFCEFKSVREKSWEKAELRRQEQTIRVAIENKGDLAKMIAEILRDDVGNVD